MIRVGAISDPERLAQYYVMSDLYLSPGDVGLGVLDALSHDLTPAVVDRSTHGPEYAYLNDSNALLLPRDTEPTEYADAVHALMGSDEQRARLRSAAWSSIRHLSIDRMAQNFVSAVSAILEGRPPSDVAQGANVRPVEETLDSQYD